MPASFSYSKSEGVYRYQPSGRKVSDRQLYQWVENAVETGGANLEKYARQLQDGAISTTDWAISAGTEIRDMHRAVAMIANGGKSQMTPSDWGFVGAKVREQLSFFNGFASEVDNIPDGATLTDAFVSRARSYYHAAYTTFAQALARRVAQNGHAEMEENLLETGSEHCEGCLAATAAGRVAIGTLTPVGDRECRFRCKCRIVYIREAA